MNIVERNIKLLKNINYPFKLISDNHKLTEIDENYDGLYNLKSLEYAIYYTFQESFTKIDHTWNKNEKIQILNDLDIILDNLYDIKEIYINSDTGEEQPNIVHDDDVIQKLGDSQFNNLYNLISGRHEFYNDKVSQYTISNIVTHNFDLFCRTLLNSKNYLYSPDLFLLDFGISNIRFTHSSENDYDTPSESNDESDTPSESDEPIELD